MNNLIKISATVIIVLLAVALFNRKQSAASYDESITKYRQDTISICLELHKAMGSLRPDALSGQNRELKEEVKEELLKRGLNIDQPGSGISKKLSQTPGMDIAIPSVLERKYLKLKHKVRESLAAVESMPGFMDDSDYRDKAADWFKSFRDLVNHDYRRLVDLFKRPVSELTESDAIDYQSVLRNIESEKSEFNETFNQARKAFSSRFIR